MAEIQRDESFRTAIKNQKRRLSATKIEKRNSITETGFPNPPAKVVPPHLKKRDSLTPPRREGFTPPRMTPPISARGTPVRALEPANIIINNNTEDNTSKASTPDIRLEFYDIEELSPLSTPATSPKDSPARTPSPSPIHINRSPSPLNIRRSPSPRPCASPIPPGSPLLSPMAISPAQKRARSFTKELLRARSFRAQRERSCSRNNSRNNSRNSSRVNSRCCSPDPEIENINPIKSSKNEDVTFIIKRSLGSRKGWKIMPEDGGDLEGEALRKVVSMIKDIEFQGFAVPERITIKS